MKKLSAMLSGTIAFLLLLTPLPQATAANQANPYGLIPDTAVATIALHPETMGKNLKTFYEDNTDALIQTVTPFVSATTYAENENLTKIYNFIKSTLQSKSIYLTAIDVPGTLTETGSKTTSEVNFFQISQSEFDSNIKTVLQNEGLISQIEYTKNPIYLISPSQDYPYYFSDIYCTEYQGFLIFSSDEFAIKYVLENTAPLNLNADFNLTKSNFLDNSSADMYIDFSTLTATLTGTMQEGTLQEEILKAFKDFSISLSEKNSTYNLKFFITQDEAKLKSLGLDYSTLRPVSLSKYFPSLNPIMFVDSSTTEGIDSYKNMFPETFDTDFANSIFPAFEKETGFLIQNSGEIFPTFTILSDISSSPEPIKALITDLSENLWTELGKNPIQTDSGTFYITKNQVTLGKSTLEQFSISFDPKVSANPYAIYLPKEILTFTITVGTTDDDLLLISSNKNIVKDYKQGLNTNSEIKALTSGNPTGVVHINTKNLGNYISQAAETIGKYTPKMKSELKDLGDTIKEITKIIGNISISSEVNNTFTSVTLSSDIDTGNLESLVTKFSNLGKNKSLIKINNSSKTFNDVGLNNWYTDDVYYLSTSGVINGYQDGSFKPSNEVTKSEFLKLVSELLNEKGQLDLCYAVSCAYIEDSATMESYIYKTFNDVDLNAWYSKYIYTAYNIGILDQISGKNIEPNKALTRGEAIHILANIAKIWNYDLLAEGMDTKTFNDVSVDSQLGNDVSLIYKLGIMTGTTDSSFSPNQKLNRAETAKIIRAMSTVIETFINSQSE